MITWDGLLAYLDEHRDPGYPNEHAQAIELLFLPGESYDDAWLAKLHDVYRFVLGQPCRCHDVDLDEVDGCDRCLLLNRRQDVYVGRGR